MTTSHETSSFTISIPPGVSIARVHKAMKFIAIVVTGYCIGPSLKAMIRALCLKGYEDHAMFGGLAAEVLKHRPRGAELGARALSFEWEIESERSRIWIHHDETLDVHQAVVCVQWLAHVIPGLQESAPWYATWATGATRPVINGFSGGAVVFTRDEAKWLNVHSWLTKNLNGMKAKEDTPEDPQARGADETKTRVIPRPSLAIGDRVYWDDPGEGVGNGPGVITGIDLSPDDPADNFNATGDYRGDIVCYLRMGSGSEAMVHFREIRALK